MVGDFVGGVCCGIAVLLSAPKMGTNTFHPLFHPLSCFFVGHEQQWCWQPNDVSVSTVHGRRGWRSRIGIQKQPAILSTNRCVFVSCVVGCVVGGAVGCVNVDIYSLSLFSPLLSPLSFHPSLFPLSSLSSSTQANGHAPSVSGRPTRVSANVVKCATVPIPTWHP
jgi:hypothetical protein